MRLLLLLLLMFFAIAPESVAQSRPLAPLPETVGQKLQFEVASVRENKSDSRPASNFPIDRGNAYSPNQGIFFATSQPLIAYIIFAYKVNVSEFRGGLMRQLPKWAITDKFDIDARAESHNPTKDEMRLMVQSLLEERFRLKVHREKRQLPVFGLYLVKNGKTGLQLRPHNPNSSCSAAVLAPKMEIPVEAMVGLWPAVCGDGTEVRISKDHLREGGRDMTMSAIADWLTGAGEFERPLLDQTGLGGTFDFIVDFDPESLGREADSSIPHDSGPTIREAMKEQLGLKVEKQEGSVSLFFIDSVEYPSAN
jgi:uncharacterized protein (TIGR03435 family)